MRLEDGSPINVPFSVLKTPASRTEVSRVKHEDEERTRIMMQDFDNIHHTLNYDDQS